MDRIKQFCKSQTKIQWIEHSIVATVLAYGGYYVSKNGIKGTIDNLLVGALKNIPGAQSLVDAKLKEVLEELKEEIGKTPLPNPRYSEFPESGLDQEQIINILNGFRSEESEYNSGRAFAGIYSDFKTQKEIISEAYKIFNDSNALFPQIFPGLRVMENDVVKMTASLLGGDSETVGSLTTGGSESILLAVKAARDRGLELKGIDKPELIAPVTAHAAFAKACKYFKIKFVCLPVDEDMKVRPQDVLASINSNTVMVVGSSPTFPHGVIDPIEELGQICLKKSICFHVDACLGGFVLPFMAKLGLLKKKFDFTVPGVTSITADLHKYGFGPKGAAVILYKHSDYRKYQFYSSTHWSGGLYTSPSMTGSRSGGVIAAAYAGILHMGINKYLEATKEVCSLMDELKSRISNIEHLSLVGNADACCLAFTSKSIPILPVADVMEKKGWKVLNRLQKPTCLMMQIGWKESFDIDTFISDLSNSVEYVESHPECEKEGMAPLYGMAASIPVDSGIGEKLLTGYLDLLYK